MEGQSYIRTRKEIESTLNNGVDFDAEVNKGKYFLLNDGGLYKGFSVYFDPSSIFEEKGQYQLGHSVKLPWLNEFDVSRWWNILYQMYKLSTVTLEDRNPVFVMYKNGFYLKLDDDEIYFEKLNNSIVMVRNGNDDTSSSFLQRFSATIVKYVDAENEKYVNTLTKQSWYNFNGTDESDDYVLKSADTFIVNPPSFSGLSTLGLLSALMSALGSDSDDEDKKDSDNEVAEVD